MNAAIPANSAIWPSCQNPDASSSIERSVVPRNTVCTRPASAVFFGCCSDSPDSCEYVLPWPISARWTAMKWSAYVLACAPVVSVWPA